MFDFYLNIYIYSIYLEINTQTIPLFNIFKFEKQFLHLKQLNMHLFHGKSTRLFRADSVCFCVGILNHKLNFTVYFVVFSDFIQNQ